MDNDLVQEILGHHILHWNYRGYEVLPNELKMKGSHVQEIYMKMNNLKILPTWVGYLKNVTNLYLSQNKLEILPQEIHEMKSLEVLDISSNQLSELPSSIGLLPRLKTLLIMNNKITAFPTEMYLLPAIITINGASNLIIGIEEICRCLTLEEIYLDNNLLVCLPSKIVYLPKLKALTLCRNNLLYLPTLPFISDVDISFDHNPSLNYIPYPLGCQITENSLYSINGQWDLRTFGCSDTTWETASLPNLKLQLTSGERLVMPLGMKYIGNVNNLPSPPSLQELSIQVVYNYIYEHNLHFFRKRENHTWHMTRLLRQLPSNLKLMLNNLSLDIKKLLLRGPISICLGYRCNTPIFSHCIAWIIPKSIAYRLRSSKEEIHSTLFFCSHKCSISFKDYLLASNPASWEEELLKSQKSWVLEK